MRDARSTTQSATGRRRFLQGLGGAATLTGFAGCLGGTAGRPSEISVAYMPIYPDMQHFVMQEEGYYDDLPVDVTAEPFSDGPSIVQAYASGDFDVALFGIVPAMIVLDKGIPAKIAAANIKNAMTVMGTKEFAGLFEEHGADAFAKFEKRKGRKFRFGTFPPGSVPDILLRYWLESELGLDPAKAVDVVAMGGAGPVRQALLAGEVDGTSIMEPVPTTVEQKGASYERVAWAGDFMPGQPAAVTLVHDRLREKNREVATAFVEQHVRATEFVNANPDAAAKHASRVIGEEALSVETARKAMDSPAADFVSDPYDVESGAKIFSEYAARLGKTDQRLSVEQLFDFSLYEDVTA
ncbi:ABC transporter substrate-binding protein [Halomicrococcus gelatinilyticus]|uniref:ABC transporter substrate-binding protein n=1 Tax=Halomicrococcus gelatinilyticus TaxID=1702103 RepID=UPI002E12B837